MREVAQARQALGTEARLDGPGDVGCYQNTGGNSGRQRAAARRDDEEVGKSRHALRVKRGKLTVL